MRKNIYIRIILFAGLIISICSCDNNSKHPFSESKTNKLSWNYPLSAIQYTTAKNSNFRLTLSDTLTFTDFHQPDEHTPTLMVDPDKQFQTIEGFGGALTDAAAETFYKLPEEKQQELLNAYFTEDGIAYNLCRVNLNSCDFSSKSYAYDTIPGDTILEHYSIEPDKKFKIPFIKRIFGAGGNIKLFASPWSPPAWMKDNDNMLYGGKLKPQYKQTWANYFVKFFDAYNNEGIQFWGLTVQNEPMAVQRWESCIYTAEEERDFVKNNLGPALANAGMDHLKIIIWDHNRGIMYQRAKIVFDDPEAAKYVWGTGYHWYTGNHFENVKQVADAYPDKKTIFTEGCVFPFDYDKLSEWHWGERYGESILHDLNNSAVGWVDWNILLDENGGPNHVSNFCYAPVIGDTRSGELIYMNSYYYLGHFSKFIQTGARRIICSSNYDQLLATAFINPDGTIIIVSLNLTNANINYKIWLDGKGFETKALSHSINTLVLK